MAEVREIPSGTYNLKFGESFHERGEKPVYHTLRFDFKPKSLAGEKETFIAFGGNGDVQVAVPGDGDALTVFKGAQKPVKGEKECLLFFDHSTGEMRIEKLSSIMSVKKTRDNEDSASIKLRFEIERLRKGSGEKSDGEMDDTKSSSSSSTVASSESCDSDSECDDGDRKSALVTSKSMRSSDDSRSMSSDTGDDDDLQEALEQQLRSQSMPSIEETKQRKVKSYPPPPLPVNSNTKKLLHDDLQLSESSDED
ncbi:RNA polymerase II transcription elongation factor family protein [Acanthocheilonema viteae]